MGEGMKTPEEIKKGLECCAERTFGATCKKCAYDCMSAKCIADLQNDALAYIQQLEAQMPRWISVEERLPEPETEVLILAKRGKHTTITTGMYEDGTNNTEDSEWWWEINGFEYDEELDAYIIPEGWWEYKHYNGDDAVNHAIDDVVTHWMPLPESPKEG